MMKKKGRQQGNIETSLILFAPLSLKTIELFKRAFSVATQLPKIS
jgi:hypothetical protein